MTQQQSISIQVTRNNDNTFTVQVLDWNDLEYKPNLIYCIWYNDVECNVSSTYGLIYRCIHTEIYKCKYREKRLLNLTKYNREGVNCKTDTIPINYSFNPKYLHIIPIKCNIY